MRLLGALPADQLRDEQQVVVVHPEQRVGGRLEGAHRRVGEPGVDLGVALPPAALEDRLLDRVVQQRPQGPVGEAVVVVAHLRGRQPDRRELDGQRRQAGRRALAAAVPADPGTGAGAHHRLQRRDQATRGELPAVVGLVHRQPVRHRDDGPRAVLHSGLLLVDGRRLPRLPTVPRAAGAEPGACGRSPVGQGSGVPDPDRKPRPYPCRSTDSSCSAPAVTSPGGCCCPRSPPSSPPAAHRTGCASWASGCSRGTTASSRSTLRSGSRPSPPTSPPTCGPGSSPRCRGRPPT